VALERGEQRDAIAHAVCVWVAAPLAVAARVSGEEEFAGPVLHPVPPDRVCAARTPPPPIRAAAAAASPSRVGVAPDVTAGTGAIPLVRATGVGGGLGQLAVEVGAGEAIASPGTPVIADPRR
jgi:hypothetical protein